MANKPIFDLSGTSALVGGIATISHPRAKLNSNIMICRTAFGGGSGGDLIVAAGDGSFTVSSRHRADQSLVTTDTSSFVYFILNPKLPAPQPDPKPVGDMTAPLVTITAPLEGATVSGTAVVVSATASDNVAVRGVKFFLDGELISGAEDTTAPYSVTFNADMVAVGQHTIRAVAFDANANASVEATRLINVAAQSVVNWKTKIIYDIDADLVTGVAANALVGKIPSRVNAAAYSGTQTNTAFQGKLLPNRINGHAAIELLKAYDGYEVPPLPAGLTALTIAFVARQPTIDITTARRIISDPSLNFGLTIKGFFECYLLNSVRSNVSSGHNLAADVPHLMIFEIDANGIRYYNGSTLLNSVAVAGATIPKQPCIGLSPYGERTDAEITRFIPFNGILTAAEKSAFIADMNALYGTGAATPTPTPTPTPTTFTVTEASPLPTGTVNTPYSKTIATSGGTAPHTATGVTAGALPAGLTANISSGAARISGTPTEAGTFNFTVSVTDSAGATASKAFAMTINTAAVQTADGNSLGTTADGSLMTTESGDLILF